MTTKGDVMMAEKRDCPLKLHRTFYPGSLVLRNLMKSLTLQKFLICFSRRHTMKKIVYVIILACINYSSFGQILEEYVPENLDVFKSDTIKYEVNADGYIDVKSIPRPDCEVFYKIANYYYNDADKIFVIPEGTEESSGFARIKKEFSRSYKNRVFKKESELSNTDFQKLLILHAPIHYYKDWSKFNLPILQEEKGFSFRGQKYTDENDGIFYMSPNIIAKTGNSITPIWNLYNSYCTLYKYVIINDNRYVKYGLLNGHEIDLEKVKTSNYKSVISKYFKFDISKSLEGISTSEYDAIVEQICETMDLDLPDFKIQCMVHSGPNGARLFSNWFPLLGCNILEDSVSFGAAHNGVIHVIGEGKGLISHESFHAIWDKLVGIRNTFFAEGTQMYYEFIQDSSKITTALEVMKKYKDYDLKSLIIGNNFFNAPHENNKIIAYPISGLFSMYLIEQYGLEKYKLLFKAEKGENGFTEVYELKLDTILADFYSWIDSK